MAVYVNGKAIPEMISNPEIYGISGERKTREEEIAEYLAHDLPELCVKHAVEENSIVNLSVSLYYGIDAAFTEKEIHRSLLNSSQARSITRRRRLYMSNNYLVRRDKKGRWCADPLLMQDEWLDQSNVHRAFVQIVKAKGWDETIERPLLCDCSVDGMKTVAWISCLCVDSRRYTLACLPQNGLILVDRTEDEFPLLDETKIKVADCYFRATLCEREAVSLMQL